MHRIDQGSNAEFVASVPPNASPLLKHLARMRQGLVALGLMTEDENWNDGEAMLQRLERAAEEGRTARRLMNPAEVAKLERVRELSREDAARRAWIDAAHTLRAAVGRLARAVDLKMAIDSPHASVLSQGSGDEEARREVGGAWTQLYNAIDKWNDAEEELELVQQQHLIHFLQPSAEARHASEWRRG